MKILMAEDEKKVEKFVRQALEQAGMTVDSVNTCADLLAILETDKYDVLVMDRLLHAEDALPLIPNLRQKNSQMKIIILSALNDLDEKVKGLTEGADDYLGKPFHVTELVARIRALARRQIAKELAQKDTLLNYEDLKIDLERQLVWRKNKKLDLTKKELKLLCLLTRSPGKVFSKWEILDQVWDMNHSPESNIVEVLIASIRNKVDKGFSSLIHSQRGLGYWLGER